jgi:hypothetical protein
MPAGPLLTHTALTEDEMSHDKTFTIEQIAEAFAAVRRDIDIDYADTEHSSERGQFYIGDVESDVLRYLKGEAGWMARQDEAARRAYAETAGVDVPDYNDDQRVEDEAAYNSEVNDTVAHWAR